MTSTLQADLAQTLELVRGTTREWSFQVVDENATPVNLTGHAGFYFTAKHSKADADADAVFKKTSAAGAVTITSPTTGEGVVKVAPADTDALEAELVVLHFDLKFVDSGGNEYVPAMGRILVTPGATSTP